MLTNPPQRRWCFPIVLVGVWALTLEAAAGTALGSEWNQWRGQARDGRSVGEDWPDSLDDEVLRKQWRVTDLGSTYSGPIVEAGQIFVTENADSKTEGITSLDAATGERLWSRDWPVDFKPPAFARRHGSWPKSTPAVDGPDVVFLGIREQLYCLHSQSGELNWSIDFPTRFETTPPEFGCSTSPLIAGDAIFVQAAGSLFKLDRRTGDVRWRTHNLYELRPDVELERETYASPILATIAGTEQLVVDTVIELVGVDVETGDVLWRAAANRTGDDAPNITPVVWNDYVLTSSEGDGTPLFRVQKSGDQFSVEEVWRSKVRGDMSSPVVTGENAFLQLKSRRLTCLDLKSGEATWTSRPEFGRYASIVNRGDKLLILTSEGQLRLLAADARTMRVLDTRTVGDRTWSHLAVTGDKVFVRDLNSLTAYEWSGTR